MSLNKEQAAARGQGDSRWDVLLVPLLGIRSSGTKGWPTWIVCGFVSMEGTSQWGHVSSHHQPIWIHAHKNVISCQLFSHVMGDFHLGIWIFLVFSWMLVPGDSDVPNKSQHLGSLAGSRLLGRQWLKSPTAWCWASGTHLHFSQIAWLITVLPPGTVYVLNLIIHQTFLRKVLHKCVRIHLDSRVGDAFWSTSVRKPVDKNVDLGICFRSHLCTLLVIYLLHVAHFLVRIIWKPV